ncbi:MAG: DNA repair protein RecO [Peptococcaceae bacterium]|nr:DNA repair protein RecO [Peptococcaceae bacterium]
MKLYRTEGIVLRSRVMREADKVLTIYTRDQGKVRAVAYGIAKPGSRKRGAAQPFSYSRFLMARGRDLDVVRQCEEIRRTEGLQSNLVTITCASYICELIELVTPDEEPDRELFKLLCQALDEIPKTKNRELLLRAFEARVLNRVGYQLHLDDCVICRKDPGGSQVVISPREGGLLCPTCRKKDPDGIPCRMGTVRLLERLFDWPLERVHALAAGAETRQELNTLLNACICYYLERKPKALAFLQKLGEI